MMGMLRDFFIIFFLWFLIMVIAKCIDEPEKLGNWLHRMDAARYENAYGLPIDRN